MIIVQTPLRVSLFGGGTDFPDYYLSEGGCVLSTAINKYIFVIIKQRYDDFLRIGYTRTEIVETVAEVQHELIREALLTTGINKGVEILTLGDIPAGSGLGSSSAVTVGTLHAMHVYLSRLVTTEQLAREACEIEITKLGKPIGVQDQYIAAYGGLRFIEFHQNGSVTADPVDVDPLVKRRLDENLLVFFTGVTRKADTILAEQKENIHQRLALLREMKDMAHEARTQLLAGNVDALGHLLHQSWLLKKQLASRISNGTIEDAYQAALAAGALGGKITGAGGGGFLLLYCPYERREAVRAALHSMQELPFHLEPDGTKVILNMRR
jgi:D-glycero-alpha-D-manno-heptose-7-phosphate kinase